MEKPRIFTKNFILDMAITLCCSLNYFTLLINIVGFATVTYGATSAEAGLAAGLYVIGGLLSRVFLGKYVELVGRRRMLIIGLVSALIMSALYFVASSLIILYIIRFLHGITYGVSSTCTADIAAKIIPASRRGEGLGYFYLAITISMAIGPFLGLILGEMGNYDYVFLVGIIMYSVAAFLAFFVKVEEEDLTPEQVANAKSFRLENLFQVSALPLGITTMVFYFGYSGVLSFISSYSQDIGMVEEANYFYLIVALGTLVSRFTTGKIYDRYGPNIIMIPGYIAFVIGMYIFATTDNSALFLASGFVIGYGISIIYAVCQAIVVTKSPAHRYGVTSSTFSSVTDLGSGLGPTLLGIILPMTGFRNMYAICALISLSSLFMYWAIHGHRAFREKHAHRA